MKNANIGRGENVEEGGSSRGRTWKEKRMSSGVRAPERLLHHMIIPNVSHKSSITNMHSFVMLALHKHRRMNFGYMALEHMLATQTSSTKCLTYGYFLTKVFQYFILNLVGVGDPIGAIKIYNKYTFKRMSFEKNEEEQKMHKRSLKGNLQRSKRSLKTTRVYEDEVIELNTLKTRRINKRSTFGVSSLHSQKEKDLGDEGKMKEKRSSPSKIKSLKTLKTYVYVRVC
ncbi:hypothetical protein M9H77_11948 [Catharanthus roseus]|uniref:Uncharacterized protein n=1 Tax=Catharanthus roseus TaxID=4058 RepID=A0ACC0BFY0_CATRO|nr:hypothetical protein M9H77_11948 [Catharanthus roseus]